jgi:hypothetical protein
MFANGVIRSHICKKERQYNDQRKILNYLYYRIIHIPPENTIEQLNYETLNMFSLRFSITFIYRHIDTLITGTSGHQIL